MTDKFVQNAIKVHGDKYDYSKVEYVSSKIKVIIICKEHGEFSQLPYKHLYGQGCRSCAYKINGNNQRNTTEQFIEKAKLINGGKYDYSKVEYVNNHTNVIIICKHHGDFKQSPNNHLSGAGCKLCANKVNGNKKTKTTEQFIKNAIKVHGDKYDYSKVEYVNNHTNVIIICKEHEKFKQTPTNHLSGKGCIKCANKINGNKKTKTTDKFIKEAITIHGDKYDYSKVEYVNNHTNVIIICKHHGDFKQSPNNHLSGAGCKLCANKVNGNKKTKTTEQFIKNAIKVHGDKYDYSKVEYVNNHTNVIIICKEHEKFKQTPTNHLSGKGCIKCANKINGNKKTKTTDKFIKEAITIHGNTYNYSKVEYVNRYTNVIIICKHHGDFKKSPKHHLQGSGCYLCNPTGHSKSQIKWLDFISSYNQIKIQHAENGGEYNIPNTNFKADGYCEKTNTIYEYHGDLWHGNPNVYDQEDTIFFGIKYGELYQRTKEREKQIKDMGYNLIVMWESDWKRINNSIRTIQNIYRLFK